MVALTIERLAILIMAGGKGERFWPRSRARFPKQFLPLNSGGTLLQETFKRVTNIVPAEMVYVVTPENYRDLTLGQLPALSPENLILEPVGRDTAPCISLAALHINRRHPDVSLVILPADHVIGNEERFLSAIKASAQAAFGASLVLLGINPDRPEVGYGYIECGETTAVINGWPVKNVVRFVEKPTAERAESFLEAGNYLWNSGMFAVRLPVLLDLFKLHLPWLHDAMTRMVASMDGGAWTSEIRGQFASLPRLSFDYGVVEKVQGCVVIPVDFAWDDVGSWAALERIWEKDRDGNVVRGGAEIIDSSGCIVYGPSKSSGRLLVVYGVKDHLIVESDDVTLVADKTRCTRIKEVLEALRDRGLERYAMGEASAGSVNGIIFSLFEESAYKVVEKPWGREVWWVLTDRYAGKLIQVNPGASLSLQYHRSKMETLLFLEGTGSINLNGVTHPVRVGLKHTIQPGTVHRVTAETRITFLEVSSAEMGDVVRLADDYGRAQNGAGAIASLAGKDENESGQPGEIDGQGYER